MLAAFALGRPEAPYRPKNDVTPNEFVRGLLQQIDEESSRARRWLLYAFIGAIVAVISTAVAVLLLLGRGA